VEKLVVRQTVNQHCYLEILAWLHEAVRCRRPELWPHAWILHHDNALAHDMLAVQEFLAKKSILKLNHPPYSPDLAPFDFWIFPKTEDYFEESQIFQTMLTVRDM
jgi:histone-lysine N-methyltransferase SETMAR